MGARIHHSPGERYGRLVVLDEADMIHSGNQTHRALRCLCDCGKETVVRAYSLRQGKTQSCGCYLADILKTAPLTHGHTANGSWSPTYMTWTAMLARCHNPKNSKYPTYGALGVTVCDRWRGRTGFQAFLDDMGDRPEGLTIDRIDVFGNYEPGNCRWATVAQQSMNKRNPKARKEEARAKLQTAFGGLL